MVCVGVHMHLCVHVLVCDPVGAPFSTGKVGGAGSLGQVGCVTAP